jgi:protein TonB
MATAAMTLGLRPRPRLGPALRRFRLPLGPLALSAVAHVMLIVGILTGAAAWRASQPKTYVVNLVPAVAAVGLPQSLPTPDLPPRAVETPRTERPVAKDLPAPPPEMPARLPDRVSPPPPALPRPGDKELPTLASSNTVRPEPATTPPAALPRPEMPPLGRPSGSPQGAGALTLNVGDFPFAWYLRSLQDKISRNWLPPAQSVEGEQVVVVFEIGRNGQVLQAGVEKRSGNPLYDQAALRAVAESNPFPELPAEFPEPMLRVHLGFTYRTRG